MKLMAGPTNSLRIANSDSLCFAVEQVDRIEDGNMKDSEFYIGAHVSAAGGVQNAPLRAEEIGANAFALFTKNQRQWAAKPLSDYQISSFKENLKSTGIEVSHVLPHNSYLINIGNPEEEKRKKSLNALIDESQRVEQLGLELLNFHPGSHGGLILEEECLDLIAEGIDQVLSATEELVLVIENTAGMGNSVGYSFEHLARLIEKSAFPERVGVCLDTCHMFAAGYDIRTDETFGETFASFDRIVGFEKLRGMHLNDSKTEFASRVDRHTSLGEGNIGWEAFKMLMKDERFSGIPLILETTDDTLWPDEIEALRTFVQEK